jgi:hypothetical protein
MRLRTRQSGNQSGGDSEGGYGDTDTRRPSGANVKNLRPLDSETETVGEHPQCCDQARERKEEGCPLADASRQCARQIPALALSKLKTCDTDDPCRLAGFAPLSKWNGHPESSP